MIKRLIFCLALSLTPFAFGNQDIENKKIKYLLERIGKSQATFIRNGEEHPAEKAKSHLKYKMERARKMFWFFGPKADLSAQEFVEKIASESSTTGKPYKIRLPSGKIYPTGQWLKKLLEDYKAIKTTKIDSEKSPESP